MDRRVTLKAELVSILRHDLAAAEQAHRATVSGATHEEAKPENDKDTRALEQSYLARGQAMRVEELRTAIAEVESLVPRAPTFLPGADLRAALGALVVVEEGDAESTYWIAPQGGGARLDGGKVHVVTPKSPLGTALVGKELGEDFDVVIAGRRRSLSVLRIE
jgi:transcription elongation GreA/GreB family factor